MVVTTIFSLTCVVIYEFKMPKLYEASSLVRLQIQASQVLPSQLQAGIINLKTAIQLVTTSLTAQEALKLVRAQKLGGMRISDSVRQCLGSLTAQDILAFVSAKSYPPDLIRISAKHDSPEVAAVLANAFAEAFIARLNREILAEAFDELRFVETQLKALRIGFQRLDKQIIEVERQLSSIKAHGEVRMLVNFIKIFTAKLMMVEAEIRDAIREKQLQQVHKQIIPSQKAFEFEQRRLELGERGKLLTSLLRQTHWQLRRFPGHQRKLSDLVRQLQVLGQAYVSLLSQVQEIQEKETVGLSCATIVNHAVVPTKPVGLGLAWLLLLALMGSLSIGIGLSLLLEFARPTVKSLNELKRIIDVPVLSVIPEARLRMKFENLTELMTSRHRVAEAVKTLRANLRFIIARQSRGLGMKTFLVTSAVKGEGKSFVTLALGIAFAQIGKRVLLVDANLLRPTLHKFFGVDGTVGLVDMLKGIAILDDALKETPVMNLKLLPAGTHRKGDTSVNPAELFNSEATLNLLQQVKEQFDLVLIDTPPVTGVTDPSILAPTVDGVLLVVELGNVTRGTIQYVKEQLDLAQARVIGLVINKASRKRSYDYDHDYCYC